MSELALELKSTAGTRLPQQRRPVIGRRPPSALSSIHVEPLTELDWSRAVEPAGGALNATCPAETRRAWIHRAPERQVLGKYREALATAGKLPAPWWLRAVARSELLHRAAGFAFEDTVHALLEARGWVYVPWVCDGEDGYWEFASSDDGRPGTLPTTIILTDRHSGWLDVLPARTADGEPEVLPLAGCNGLRVRVNEIESW